MKNTRNMRLVGTLGVTALVLTACNGDGEGNGEGGENAAEDIGTVTIGYTPWDEVIAATYLWEYILEDQGADVELVQLEPAAVYSGAASGDTDLYMGGLEHVHEDYWEAYSDDFEIVVEAWHEPHRHALTVPEYVDAESITDLEGNAEEFGGRIVGIEPGSGLMNALEVATETYDLEDYEVIEGSTAAMLAEFENAINAEEPIVVTAWSPHWAVSEYNMKFLEDPEEIFSFGDRYHVIGGEAAFGNEALMDLMDGFSMDEELFELMGEIVEAGTGNERQAVETWLEDDANQALVDSWVGE